MRSQSVRKLAPEMDPLRIGMGWTVEDLEKPQILVESTFGDSHPGSAHLLELVNRGLPGRKRRRRPGRAATLPPTSATAWPRAMTASTIPWPRATRSANLIEIHERRHALRRRRVPRQLRQGRARAPDGHRPHKPARRHGHRRRHGAPGPNLLTLEQIGTVLRHVRSAARSPRRSSPTYKHHACPSCGACSFMGTASHHADHGRGPGPDAAGHARCCPPLSPDLKAAARRAGRAGRSTWPSTTCGPRDMVTRESFENAIMVHAAISGSTNALMHVPAIAHEFGVDLDADTFDRMHRGAHYLLDIRPAGRFPAEYFYYAGGVPRVMEEIKSMLHLDARTVTGKTLGENLEDLRKTRLLREVRRLPGQDGAGAHGHHPQLRRAHRQKRHHRGAARKPRARGRGHQAQRRAQGDAPRAAARPAL